MAQLTITVPNAKAARVLAAYGTKEAAIAAAVETWRSRVQEFERNEARKAVVEPAAPDFSDLTGNLA